MNINLIFPFPLIETETFVPKKMKSSIKAKREELALPAPGSFSLYFFLSPKLTHPKTIKTKKIILIDGEIDSEEAAKRYRENVAKKEDSATNLKKFV